MHDNSLRVTWPLPIEIDWIDPERAFAPWADTPGALLLGAGSHERGGWAFLAVEPDRQVAWSVGEGPFPFDVLRSGQADARPDPAAPPFRGGWAGVLSYEAGAGFDRAPRWSGPRPPDLWAGHYPVVAAFDLTARRAMVCALPGAGARAQALASQLAAATPMGAEPGIAHGMASARQADASVADQVARVVAYAQAGDIFQANLSRSWTVTLGEGDTPFDLFRRIGARGPAPFGAFARLPYGALVSNSPERLVGVRAETGGLLATASPIKGTRPRRADPDLDRAERLALAGSVKDRAENLMIVDLVRNDLSRIAARGGVTAGPLFALESYASLHHLTSTVTARLAPGRDGLDALAAMFPGGSITGAPKIRAQEIIAELEGEPRGPWCGSAFWFGADGTLDASILIRTVLLRPQAGGWTGTLRAGAGITVASDPMDEAREMTLKASLLVQEITGTRALSDGMAA